MLRIHKKVISGVNVEITKLSADRALGYHGKIIYFLGKALPAISEGVGASEEKQALAFGEAISAVFTDLERSEEFTNFIRTILTDGSIALKGERVQHLDDFSRFDDVDGSVLMYQVLVEWMVFNVGTVLGNLVGNLDGSKLRAVT